VGVGKSGYIQFGPSRVTRSRFDAAPVRALEAGEAIEGLDQTQAKSPVEIMIVGTYVMGQLSFLGRIVQHLGSRESRVVNL
jgi:hypothetical protein